MIPDPLTPGVQRRAARAGRRPATGACPSGNGSSQPPRRRALGRVAAPPAASGLYTHPLSPSHTRADFSPSPPGQPYNPQYRSAP